MATDLINEIDSWIDTFDKVGIAQFIVPHGEAKALLATLKRAREALDWIPCSKRLPEMKAVAEWYLCTVENSDGTRYIRDVQYGAGYGGWAIPGVRAWMERPAPYAPAKEGE